MRCWHIQCSRLNKLISRHKGICDAHHWLNRRNPPPPPHPKFRSYDEIFFRLQIWSSVRDQTRPNPAIFILLAFVVCLCGATNTPVLHFWWRHWFQSQGWSLTSLLNCLHTMDSADSPLVRQLLMIKSPDSQHGSQAFLIHEQTSICGTSAQDRVCFGFFVEGGGG